MGTSVFKFSPVLASLLILFSIGCTEESSFTKVEQNDDISIASAPTNQNVNAFCEDSDGYMWIGTDVGLNRYDGDTYLQFLSSPTDSMSLVHSKIYSIFEDSKKQLWVGSRAGIDRLREDMKWDRFKINSISNNVFDIFENSKGVVFAGNRWSLFKQSADSLTFNEVLRFWELEGIYSKTCIDSNDDIWLVQDHKIVQYNGETYENVFSTAIEKDVIGSLMDNYDRLWILHDRSVEIFDTRRLTFLATPEALATNPKMLESGLKSLYRSSDGIVFVTKSNGLYFYNFNKETLTNPRQDYPAAITAYYADSNLNTWIGFSNKDFIIYQNSNHLTDGEIRTVKKHIGSTINAISKGHDGDLWVLSNNSSISVLEMVGNNVMSFNATEIIPHGKTSQAQITSFVSDKKIDNLIWVLAEGTVYRCSLKGTTLECSGSYPTNSSKTRGIFQDSHGGVYVYGSGHYIYYLQPGKSSFEKIHISDVALTEVTHMVESGNGEILVCCNYRNIYRIDLEKYDSEEIIDIGSFNYEPTSMILDSHGSIWVTANGSPIKKFVPEQNSYETINFEGSMYNTSILEDNGYMWIGSQHGLFRYEIATGRHFVFYEGDGVIGNQFSTNASCKLDDGKLVFGSTTGLSIIDPDVEATISENTPFKIDYIESGDNIFFNTGSKKDGRIVLNHKNNNLTIHYSAINYDVNTHIRYEYKLDGVDKSWYYAHEDRTAHYTNIPYGKTNFHVRLIGIGNNQTGIEDNLEIVIRRPLLLSTVSKIIMVLLLSLISYQFYKAKRRSREKDMEVELSRREKEQQILLNEKNIDYFTSISHEFRTPLTMVLGAADSLLQDEEISVEDNTYAKILYRNIRRMQKLVDQILAVSKLENGSLNLSVRLMNVIPKCKEIIEAFRISSQAKRMDFIFDCPEDSILSYLDEDAFEKMLYNLLSNAVKYTPQGGTIYIKADIIDYETAVDKFMVGSDDKYVRIRVSDSGIGIPEDKREIIFNKYYQVKSNKSIGGTGIGLYFTKMLVTLHHGDIICEGNVDNNGNEIPGTQFTFILPINQKSYTKEEISNPSPIKIQANPTILSEYVETSPINDLDESDKPTILAIDDDPEVLHYIKSLLSPYYRMVLRFDATTGYEAIAQVSPDLIISDVLMLDIDGFEFCRMVKDNSDYSHIPVILLTAKTTTEDQIKGMEAHADAYVTKPFEPNFLKALIKSTLEKQADAKRIISNSTISIKDKLNEVLKEKDREFMEAVYNFMEAELENEEVNVTAMYEQMYMSRTKFYNKIKNLTGETPANFFRTYKLNRAKELLETGEYKIAAVAAMTGFCSSSHFSTLFKKQFGITPTEYISGKPIQ